MNFIDEALKEANKSPMKNKYGALLIYRNKIISRGYNKFKGKPTNNCLCIYESNKYSSHAEQNCISNCKNKKLIKKSDMILLRISYSEDARPCNMCQHIINKYNINNLYILSLR